MLRYKFATIPFCVLVGETPNPLKNLATNLVTIMSENESVALDKRAKRQREISIRVNDYELAEIKKRNRGSTVASWLRGLALGVTPVKPVDPVLVRQLGRLGSNLNQITKYIHTQNGIDIEALAEIKAIRQELHRLIDISIEQSKLATRNSDDC